MQPSHPSWPIAYSVRVKLTIVRLVACAITGGALVVPVASIAQGTTDPRRRTFDELLDMNAVKKEAVEVTAELLGGLRGPHFWSGEPWKLWVTNQANGAGKILLTLVFSAKLSDDSSLAPDPALTAMPV